MNDENRSNLLALAGPHGTGKSHCLEALGPEFNARGIPTQYHNMSRLDRTSSCQAGFRFQDTVSLSPVCPLFLVLCYFLPKHIK